MGLPVDLLFVPTWLALVRPRPDMSGPFSWWVPEGCPAEYPRSRLTARTVTSDMGPTASGTIVAVRFPTREELLAHEARVVGARRARKAARAAEMRTRWMRTDPNGYADRNARAERRAAREARRIMMARRAACVAAFTKEELR